MPTLVGTAGWVVMEEPAQGWAGGGCAAGGAEMTRGRLWGRRADVVPIVCGTWGGGWEGGGSHHRVSHFFFNAS